MFTTRYDPSTTVLKDLLANGGEQRVMREMLDVGCPLEELDGVVHYSPEWDRRCHRYVGTIVFEWWHKDV